MSTKNEPAFPRVSAVDSDGFWSKPFDGLTKREYYAAKAMQGVLADYGTAMSASQAAKWAVEFADALIAALEEKP